MRSPREPHPASLSISGLRRSFRTGNGARRGAGPDEVEVLRGVDLDVEPGEIVALLGPSGCGKTTVLRLIAGLDAVGSGSISVGDRLVSGPSVHVATEARRVGMVFQDGALFPHLSVARNVGYGLERGERTSGPRIDEMLRLVGLDGFAERLPDSLSGGQRQRVALARALAPQPAVLLLDEPFSNLDAVLRTRLRLEVVDLVRAAGVTTVFVTHDRDEAFVVADRVAVMRDGRIVQVGAAPEVYRHPVDTWVAGFLGEVNLLDAAVSPAGPHLLRCELGDVDASFRVVDGAISVADDGSAGHVDGRGATVAIRPEAVTVRELDDPGVGSGVGRRGERTKMEFRGPLVVASYRLDSGTVVRVAAPSTSALPPHAVLWCERHQN